MAPSSLVITALLLHAVAFLPNLFDKHLPITGSLAAKVTGYRSWFHQLLLMLSVSFRFGLYLHHRATIINRTTINTIFRVTRGNSSTLGTNFTGR
jgi:hypothetical protein